MRKALTALLGIAALAVGTAGPAMAEAARPAASGNPSGGQASMKLILDALNSENGVKATMLTGKQDVISVSTPEWPRVLLSVVRGDKGQRRMAKAMLMVPVVDYLPFEHYNRFNRKMGFGTASKLDDGAAELSISFALTDSEHDGRICADAVGFVRIMLGSFVELTNRNYPGK